MVIYDIVNIIGPLFTHFGLVSCLCLSQWPLAFLMTPSDWTISCHVLIMDDGRGWKHHRGTYKFLCRMDNFSGIYFNYIDINYTYINKKNWLFYMTQWKVSFSLVKKMKCYYDQVHFLLSGVPDYFYRNKISSGGDLSHYSSASLY